jgi:hypothetical protein
VSVLGSLRRGVGAVVGNPSMFVVALAYALVSAPQVALSAGGYAWVSNGYQLVTLLVTPLFVAGTIGMALEALRTGETSLGRFLAVGRDRYLAVLFAQLAQFAGLVGVAFAGAVVVAVAAIVVGLGSLAGGTATGGLGSTVTSGAFLLVVGLVSLLVLVVLLVVLFLQFYAVAAVVEETGAIDSVRRSIGFVRNNFVRTLGYSLLLFVVGLLNSVPTIWLVFGGGVPTGPGGAGAATGFGVDTKTALLFAGYSLAVTAVLFPFQQAFATAFFVDHRDADAGGDGRPSTSGVGDGAVVGTD